MAVTPTFPTFVHLDHQISKLQKLSYAVGFACRCPVIFHLYKTANQSIAANTQVAVQWDAASADSDNGWGTGHQARYTVQTPGYFHVDAGVNCGTSGVDGEWQIAVRVTTGSGNPAGAGIQSYVIARGDDMGAGSNQESLSFSGTTPYLYAGDYMEVVVFCTQSTSITAAWNTSSNVDENGFPDGSPTFTGMLVSLGP